MGPAIDSRSLASPFCFPPSNIEAACFNLCRSVSPSTIRFPTSHLQKALFSRNSALRVSSHRSRPGIVVANLSSTNLGEDFNSDVNPPSSKEVSFDIGLPRRNLMVKFTCNACGERTQRRINRAAYERGTVFLQCAGCLVYHKLVDNLGLVVEYDLREDLGANSDDTK